MTNLKRLAVNHHHNIIAMLAVISKNDLPLKSFVKCFTYLSLSTYQKIFDLLKHKAFFFFLSTVNLSRINQSKTDVRNVKYTVRRMLILTRCCYHHHKTFCRHHPCVPIYFLTGPTTFQLRAATQDDIHSALK